MKELVVISMGGSLIVTDPREKVLFKEDILVAAGWKPGFSIDYDAVLLAENLGARRILNLTNTPSVYDRDPKEYPDAKPIDAVSWKEFRRLIPRKWSPGLSSPFDPVAAKEAERLGLTVIVLGNDLENLKCCLSGKRFRGTVIRS